MDEEGYVRDHRPLEGDHQPWRREDFPREVDEVPMDHYPAVQQCVTFALPHDKLGEDVAAAVVLREGAQAGEKDLREFAAKRLADFKVLRKILILPEIPKGATGKTQRIGLAQKLRVDAVTLR